MEHDRVYWLAFAPFLSYPCACSLPSLLTSGFQWADLIPSTQRQGTICIIVADSDCFHGVQIFNTLQYDMY